MYGKIVPVIVAVLIGSTALAAAQTQPYMRDRYGNLYGVVPTGPDYDAGPFIGTFSEGLPYWSTYGWGPSNYYNYYEGQPGYVRPVR